MAAPAAMLPRYDGLRSPAFPTGMGNGMGGAMMARKAVGGGRRKGGVRAMAVSAPKRETDPKKRVVITGMGLVSVFGNDVNTFYDKLLEGTSGISLIDRFDVSKFPTKFAGQIRGFGSKGYIDGKNDRRLDDSLRYCLVSGKRALEDAGLGGEHLNQVTNATQQEYKTLCGISLACLLVFQLVQPVLGMHTYMSPSYGVSYMFGAVDTSS